MTTTTLTNPGLEQRMAHLQRANRIRLARADLKRALAEGRKELANVILDPPECVASMWIIDLICCADRWGPSRASKLLFRAHISASRPVGALTMRQCALLGQMVGGWR